MGEPTWHYFAPLRGGCPSCGRGELEILDFATFPGWMSLGGRIEVLTHRHYDISAIIDQRGKYRGYCHGCRTEYGIFFTKGSDVIRKVSVTLGT